MTGGDPHGVVSYVRTNGDYGHTRDTPPDYVFHMASSSPGTYASWRQNVETLLREDA